MPLSIDELRDILKESVVTDVFKAERAYALLSTIGQHADAINTAQLNFAGLFRVIQGHATTEAMLAIARLYDHKSNDHETRSVRTLLSKLNKQRDELPPINRYNLENELKRQGVPPTLLSSLESESDSVITRQMTGFFLGRLNQPEAKRCLKQLKNVRDKQIAHNEEQYVDGPTWQSLQLLLSIAKNAVGAIGCAYLSTIYTINGDYLLSGDAKRSETAMRRLLEQLEIIEPRFPELFKRPHRRK